MLNLETKTFSDLPGAMCDPYGIVNPNETLPLDDFQTLVSRKFTGSYTSYYPEHPCNSYGMDVDTSAVYQELHSPKEMYLLDDRTANWRIKYVADWTADDTIAFILDVAHNPAAPIHETDIPFFKFRDCPGYAFKDLTKESMRNLMSFPGVSRESARRNGDIVYSALEQLRDEQSLQAREAAMAPPTVLRNYPYMYEAPSTLIDLDRSQEMPSSVYEFPNVQTQGWDSGDDVEDRLRPHDSASPEYSYGSDASKSGDELDDKSKVMKRPPGRPKGSGKKPHKRVKNVSVPEFLKDLLLDPQYCPSIIRWEKYEIGQFRFVKPDEVAKLWGRKKQNDKMSFEKFSRAMRYHYRGEVLVSVPTARLVYQFGRKGPAHFTDDPNFEKLRNGHEM